MSARLNEIDQNLREQIAKRMTELRESTGKKQSHFALENLITEKQVLHRLEAGRGASIYSINKFCKALNITLKDFFDSKIFD